MEELKPCPICGGASQMSEWRDIDGDWFFSILCPVCEIEIKQKTSIREAIAAWNALPRRLKWTKEKPTKDGWYWWRTGGGCNLRGIVSVCIETDIMSLAGAYKRLSETTGEWAGPIPEPMPEAE